MWFQNKSIFLKIDIKHSSPHTGVEYYDTNFVKLKSDLDTIAVKLPNKIIVRFTDVVESELVKVSLSGLKFNNESLLQILEYRACKYKLDSVKDLEKFPVQRTTKCVKDGYFIINLFHRNPFAVHLYTSNTIPFKL